MANPTREDTWFVSVSIDGRNCGPFDSLSGGEVDSEEAKYNPGGMVGEISLGGRRTIGNLTVGRYYDWARDHPLMAFLYDRAGKGRGSIGAQPLDVNGTPRGNPLTYEGTLKTVTRPDIDSTGTDAAVLELEFTIDTAVAPA